MLELVTKAKICINCSLNKQYVKGVQKRKKVYLKMMDSNIDKQCWVYCATAILFHREWGLD